MIYHAGFASIISIEEIRPLSPVDYCYWLIYYEEYESIKRAIERVKELKGCKRFRKHELINIENAGWRFLNAEVCEFWPPKEENTS